MLYCLGPHIHQDPPLLAKVLRVGRVFLKARAANRNNGELPSEEKEDVYHGLLSTLDEVVLPALSLMPCNCGMAEEAWAMVKQLPYETRYMYMYMYVHMCMYSVDRIRNVFCAVKFVAEPSHVVRS